MIDPDTASPVFSDTSHPSASLPLYARDPERSPPSCGRSFPTLPGSHLLHPSALFSLNRAVALREEGPGSTAIPQPEAQLSSLSPVVQQPRRRTLVLLPQTPRASFYADQDPSPPSPPATPPQSSPHQFSEHLPLHRSHPFEEASQPAQQRPRRQALVSTSDLPRAESLDSNARVREMHPLASAAFHPSHSTPDPATLQHSEAQHGEQEHHQPKQHYLHQFQPRQDPPPET